MSDAWWRTAEAPVLEPRGPVTEGSRESTDSRVAFGALLAFTLILLLAPQQMLPVLAPFRIAMLAALLGIVAHTMSRLSHGRPLIVLTPGVTALLFLAGWVLFTIPFSYWPGGSVSYFLDSYLKTLLVFLLLVNVVTTLERIRYVILCLIGAAVPLSLTVVKNMLGGVYMEGGARVVGYNAPLTANPNDMALMLNLLLPLAIGTLLLVRRLSARLLFAGIVILMMTGIVATFSRAGFLTMMVTCSVYAWRIRARPGRAVAPVALLLMLAAIPLLPSAYLERIGTITDIESDPTGSSQARASDSLAALRLSLSQPIIGSGIGMNALALNEERGVTWTEVHNVYLTLAVELGYPGLLLFILVMAGAFRSTRAGLSEAVRARDRSLFLTAESIRVSLIAFSVAAFFHPVAYHFYFYYIAALAICLMNVIGSVDARNKEVAV